MPRVEVDVLRDSAPPAKAKDWSPAILTLIRDAETAGFVVTALEEGSLLVLQSRNEAPFFMAPKGLLLYFENSADSLEVAIPLSSQTVNQGTRDVTKMREMLGLGILQK